SVGYDIRLPRVRYAPLKTCSFPFRTFVKRGRHHTCLRTLPAYFYCHRASVFRMCGGHICESDVLLEKWRVRSAGYVPYFVPRVVQHLVSIARNPAFHHLESD